jgi:hypothetical protein
MPYLAPFTSSGLPAPEGHHAVFAARVSHWPFERLGKHTWVARALEPQAQLLDRQLHFIAAVHASAQALRQPRLSVDLRYIHRPNADRVECVLIGKTFAPEQEQAEAIAAQWWEALANLAPIGYRFDDIKDSAEFDQATGADLVHQADDPAQWAFVQRRVDFLPWTDVQLPVRHLPVFYPLQWHLNGFEAVWATLAQAPTPALVSVALRPTQLHPNEALLLAQLGRELAETAAQAADPLKTRATEALGYLHNYLRAAQALYHFQITALGSTAIHASVRAALSGPDWGGVYKGLDHNATTVEMRPPTESQMEVVRNSFLAVEPIEWDKTPPAIYSRLRDLTDAAGALCAFRLPLLPPNGVPGLDIGHIHEPR